MTLPFKVSYFFNHCLLLFKVSYFFNHCLLLCKQSPLLFKQLLLLCKQLVTVGDLLDNIFFGQVVSVLVVGLLRQGRTQLL